MSGDLIYMTRNALLGAQVKQLLSSVSEHSAQHLTEAETDLVQTGILLAEAIEKLSASFMAIHEAMSAQQQAVEILLSGIQPTPEITRQLKARQDEIGLHVNAAVTGLQFQDMTNQLISRAVRRVTGLRDLIEGVGAGGTDVAPEDDSERLTITLDNINKVLEAQSLKLENELWKAVCQTHMESGDIELF
jgi:hypothetical protein